MSVPIPFLCKARLITSANVVKNQRACEFHGPLFKTNTKYVINKRKDNFILYLRLMMNCCF